MDSKADKLEEPLSVFKAACEQFRASLSEKNRQLFQEYPNAVAMLEAIHDQAQNHPTHKGLLMRCSKNIAFLAAKLGPYFEIINIFVSSHPEFAGLAWGSLRLVFLLGTNHAEFLERVCELLGTMSAQLPAYEEFLRLWQTQRRAARPPTRMLRAMGYIYADLIQFCFDVCQMLSRKRSAFLSLRGSFLSSLPSTLVNPFHVRYDTLLKRWEQHHKIIQLEISVLSGLELLENRNRIDLILKKFNEVGMFENKNTKSEWRNMDEIRHRLQTWINSPPWLGLFEMAQSQRELDSTEWFIDHPDVAQWISRYSRQEVSSFQVLFTQGKPGFGKTTLCTSLIEHLRKHVAASWTRGNSQDKRRSALAFFYFDKQRQDSVQNSAVWRAILMQLLHVMPTFDPDVIDMFLLFRENQQLAGQPLASDNEIFAVLCLLTQRLDDLVLVIDGIDECTDQFQFWHRLKAICDGPTATSVALFSRPTVTLPPRLMEASTVLALESTMNIDGICAYLRQRIMNMVDSDYLGRHSSSHDWEHTVKEIARRANGMFLWATLFVEYLQSPHISIRERQEAIGNLNRLEGLDMLYQAILRTLTQRPGSARANTLETFGLVLYSMRPLHISELQHAIATPMDRTLDPDDLIPQFSSNLGRLSGALMEVDKDGFVRFVHLSLIEYLTDAKRRTPQQHGSPDLVLDRASSHASLACRCLSYLYHSVKAEPLAGSPRVVPDLGMQTRRYPLLDYATGFWSHHVLECMEALDSRPMAPPLKPMVQLASKFLSNRQAVMAWIEASWMFKRPPQIRHGPSDPFLKGGQRMPPHLDTHLQPAWETAWLTLLQLSQDLASLNNSWGHVLKKEPNEIWEPSISAFNQSRFWQRISGARIAARFEATEDPDFHSISLRTRLSPDGRTLGLIRLYISRQDNTRMSLSYEHWSIDPNVKVQDLNLNIPRTCLKPFLLALNTPPTESLPTMKGAVQIPEQYLEPIGVKEVEFQCPVAITSDLRRVAAPGCIVQIPSLDNGQLEPDLDNSTQFVDFTGNAWRNGPFRFGIEDFELCYDIQLSDTGKYLMTVHKSNGIVDVDSNTGCHLRLLTVYEDTNINTPLRPSYRHLASLAFKPDYLATDEAEVWTYDGDRQGNSCALLHPRYPVVAIKYQRFIIRAGNVIKRHGIWNESTESVLWNFEDPTSNCLRYVSHRPKKIIFDHDGEYFCGIAINNKNWPTPSWNTASSTNPSSLPPSKDRPNLSPPAPSLPRQPHHNLPLHFHAHFPSQPRSWDLSPLFRSNHPPPTQNLGELTSYVDRHTGLRAISQLRDGGRGTVVLTTLRENGMLEAETIARLPEGIAGDYKAVVMNVDGSGNDDGKEQEAILKKDDDKRVIFLDREDRPFRRYKIPTVEEAQDEQMDHENGNGIIGGRGQAPQLPLVLHRKMETIPVVVGEGAFDAESGVIGWKRVRGVEEGVRRVSKRRLLVGEVRRIESAEEWFSG